MCLRCSPTLPLLKDHLVWFLSLCEDDGDFQNLVWFFFHWSKFRFRVVGFVWIFNSGRDGFIPNAKSKEQSKAVLSWWIHCECWTFIFKHFQMFITLALAAPLPVCTNKCKTDFWCKYSRVCTATAASIAACVWPGQNCCFLLQLWGSGVSWGCSTGYPCWSHASPVTTWEATKAVTASLSHTVILSF